MSCNIFSYLFFHRQVVSIYYVSKTLYTEMKNDWKQKRAKRNTHMPDL